MPTATNKPKRASPLSKDISDSLHKDEDQRPPVPTRRSGLEPYSNTYLPTRRTESEQYNEPPSTVTPLTAIRPTVTPWTIIRPTGTSSTGTPSTDTPSTVARPTITRSIVTYIPSRMDSPTSPSASVSQQSPVRLFIKDAGVLLKMFGYFPNIFIPFKSQDFDDEFHLTWDNLGRMMLSVLLFIVEALLLLVVVPASLILPGIGTVIVASIGFGAVYLLTTPVQGPTVCHAKTASESGSPQSQERWLFVNGCATDFIGLKRNIDLISATFSRDVIGIHNRSFGLIGDLIECLIQRCFSYNTHAVREAYARVKPLLIDPDIKKVVFIGHSQGGIIISLVIDQLFAELSQDDMAKLEIYTFGSAASHFSNPLLKPASSPSSSGASTPRVRYDGPDSPAGPKRVIQHIEHYANEYDMIPRWGVLSRVGEIQSSRYAGSVFVNMGASGHFFNQHYLKRICPILTNDRPEVTTDFLDSPVEAQPDTNFMNIASPSSGVMSKVFGVLRRDSRLQFGSGQVLHSKKGKEKASDYEHRSPTSASASASSSSAPPPVMTTAEISGRPPLERKHSSHVMVFSRSDSGIVVGEEASGKTVRQLSRLWQYIGGKSPEDEDLNLTRMGGRRRLASPPKVTFSELPGPAGELDELPDYEDEDDEDDEEEQAEAETQVKVQVEEVKDDREEAEAEVKVDVKEVKDEEEEKKKKKEKEPGKSSRHCSL